ncbi:hypothetical protein MIND_01207000 [Mycena indigotica]|uniref:Uncharacterized protein n=1 Tax=Mycena indigotica TaxID=2126181 RepID=A0A8H6S594_9AGAR|nr:uncharacterized protein MIND_01207000 [Mycena indigotica]KAF7293076.1 hypothetical protein MIND_01207000 [Mycena indigotica]
MLPSPSEPVPQAGTMLERPPLVHTDAIFHSLMDELHPELAHIPLPFIQHQIAECRVPMIRGLASVDDAALQQTSGYQGTAIVRLLPDRDLSEDEPGLQPTHLLAISTRSAPLDPPRFVAIHGMVMAMYCSAPILNSKAAADGPDPDTVVLPVTTLVLPSVPAFYALRAYMYAPHPLSLLQALFPGALSWGGLVSFDNLGSQLFDSIQSRANKGKEVIAKLQNYALRVRDVWLCAWTLAVYRTELWDALDLASAVVVHALGLAVARQNNIKST